MSDVNDLILAEYARYNRLVQLALRRRERRVTQLREQARAEHAAKVQRLLQEARQNAPKAPVDRAKGKMVNLNARAALRAKSTRLERDLARGAAAPPTRPDIEDSRYGDHVKAYRLKLLIEVGY